MAHSVHRKDSCCLPVWQSGIDFRPRQGKMSLSGKKMSEDTYVVHTTGINVLPISRVPFKQREKNR